jgi:hypothetical protein
MVVIHFADGATDQLQAFRSLRARFVPLGRWHRRSAENGTFAV